MLILGWLVSHLPLLVVLAMLFVSLYLMLMWKFLSVSSHVLLMMLILEFLMLTLFLAINFTKTLMAPGSAMLMMFFTLAVCEASIGLGLLIQISRKTGSEHILVLYFFKL